MMPVVTFNMMKRFFSQRILKMKIRARFFLLLLSSVFAFNALAQEFVSHPVNGMTILKDIDFVTTTEDVQNRCPQYNGDDVNQFYTPSFNTNLTALKSIFQELPYGNGGRFRNQCFMRAHVWSYMMWRNHGIKSLKIFLFFTNQSKLVGGPGWWFHVAPMVMDNSGKAWVMDRQFTDGPLAISDWLNEFVIKGTKCPIVNHYSAYEDNQKKFDCFVRIVPMYYLPPLDIENADKSQQPKRFEWSASELNTAKTHFPFFTRGSIPVDRLR
jgi:hypothetical protein